MKTKTITGCDAIAAKERNSKIILCKHADPIEDANVNLSLEMAREVAQADPSLIYARVPDRLEAGEQFVALQIKMDGTIEQSEIRTVKPREQYVMAEDEISDGNSRYTMNHFWPESTGQKHSEVPMSMSIEHEPYVYARVADIEPASKALREAYIQSATDRCREFQEAKDRLAKVIRLHQEQQER